MFAFLPPANEVWSKIMFLHLSVIQRGGRLPSMHHRSHDPGGLHPGGLHLGVGIEQIPGSAYLPSWGIVHPPRYMGNYEIRSTSRRYASYWNAFLSRIEWQRSKKCVNGDITYERIFIDTVHVTIFRTVSEWVKYIAVVLFTQQRYNRCRSY